MKSALVAGLALFITGVAVAVIQLWFAPWSAAVFVKIELTLGAVLLVALAVWFTRKEYSDYQRQHRDAELDG